MKIGVIGTARAIVTVAFNAPDDEWPKMDWPKWPSMPPMVKEPKMNWPK